MATSASVQLADLRDHGWITARHDVDPHATLLDRACREAGFEANITCRVDDYDMIGHCVAVGLGVALIPMLGAGRLPAGVNLVRIKGVELAREICVTHLGDGACAPAASFVRHLRDAAQDLPLTDETSA